MKSNRNFEKLLEGQEHLHSSLEVEELRNNFFQFFFSNTEVKERVLHRWPWFFDNQVMVLQPWRNDQRDGDLSFKKSLIWIQIKGLPTHWSSVDVGWKLGKLSSCFNVVLPVNGREKDRMLKLLVEIELEKLILRGTKIWMEEEMVCVEFQYENLPTFCFYCGRISHSKRGCEHKMEDSRNNCICEGQYGSWLSHNL